MPRMLAVLIFLLSLLLVGCPPAGDACSEEGEQECVGDEIRTCNDGSWSEPTTCDAGSSCMAMESGLEHCMEM